MQLCIKLTWTQRVYSPARSSIPPNIPWMNLLFKSWIRWYRCSCKFQIHLCIPACVMSWEFTRKAVIKFLQAYFPEFDVNVFKAMLFILRFWIWPNTEKSLQNIHCSWCMQECRFELDISYGNLIVTYHFSKFDYLIINSLIESWGYARTCLDCNSH